MELLHKPDAVARLLGISVRTVTRLRKCGVLRGTSVGRQWRYHPADLNAYLRKARGLCPIEAGVEKKVPSFSSEPASGTPDTAIIPESVAAARLAAQVAETLKSSKRPGRSSNASGTRILHLVYDSHQSS